MAQCSIANPQTCYELKKTGIWGEAVRQRKPIIINDYQAAHPLKKGYPPGHAHLCSFLTIPIFKDDKIISVVAVANKACNYTNADVFQLILLMDAVWKVLDKYEAKQQLYEKTDQLMLISDNFPNGMVFQIDMGIDGKERAFTYVSAGVKRLHGVEVAEALSDASFFYNQIVEEDRGIVAENEKIALASMSVFSVEARFQISPDTFRWRLLTSAIRRLPNGHLVWDGIEIDITELMEARKAAESASKTKSEFLANMSHEIRTPLNGVLGMLELLKTTNPSVEQKQYIFLAIKSINRLTRLLSDILDISRIESGKMPIINEEFEIIQLKKSILEVFTPSLNEKKLIFEFVVDDNVPERLIGDEARLRQVLFNLVGNAIKFTEHGFVKVEVVSLPYYSDCCIRVLFTVQDTGIGIPEQLHKAIFEPFMQVENSYTRRFQGAGLGLSIVRKLVKLMNGELAIDSTEGQGTTVYLSLPFKLPDAMQFLVNQSLLINRSVKSKQFRVLFADDDEISLISGKLILEKYGFIVVTALNGREALNLLADQEFDFILMDVQMPIMDGVEATRAIRNSTTIGLKSNIPIIAMTAFAMTGDKEKFLAAGMNDYISKPVEIDTLKEVIERMMGKLPQSLKPTTRPIEVGNHRRFYCSI